jgi:cytochrome d ubiquinol oxidase subunit II
MALHPAHQHEGADVAAPSGTLTALLVATAGFALIVLPAFVLIYVLDQKS